MKERLLRTFWRLLFALICLTLGAQLAPITRPVAVVPEARASELVIPGRGSGYNIAANFQGLFLCEASTGKIWRVKTSHSGRTILSVEEIFPGMDP